MEQKTAVMQELRDNLALLTFSKEAMVTLNNYINEALLFLKPYEAELKYNYSYGMLQGNAKKYQLVKGPMENSKVSIQELANNFNQSRRNAMADIDKCLLTLAPNHHNLNAPAEV